MKRKIIGVTIAVLIGAIAYDSFYIINETQQGVLTHFGKIRRPCGSPDST